MKINKFLDGREVSAQAPVCSSTNKSHLTALNLSFRHVKIKMFAMNIITRKLKANPAIGIDMLSGIEPSEFGGIGLFEMYQRIQKV